MLVASGSYTGTGVAGLAVNVGFPPLVVLVKEEGAAVGHIALSSFDAGDSKEFGNTALVTTKITALTATGFEVSSNADINDNSVTYFWTAWGDSGDDDIACFSYTGDGTDNKSWGSLTWEPDFAMVIADATLRLHWRTDMLAGDLSQRHNVVATTNIIQALQTGGIQAGTTINANGTVYHVWALKRAANVCAITEYQGDGNDNRDVAHGLGVAPIFTMIQTQDVTSQSMVTRFADHVGDLSIVMDAAASAANSIQAVDATNVQVGTDAKVNQAASTPTYTLVTFGEAVPAPPATGGGGLALLGVG